MHTFNIGVVFGQNKAVVIIVCASEEPIDKQKVQLVTAGALQKILLNQLTAKQGITEVVKAIKKECGVNAVSVEADIACHLVPLK